FWALYVVAALAHEVRAPKPTLRVSSAMLLFADVVLVAGAGWGLLHDRGRTAEATAWVLGVAAAHLAIGLATLRGRISRQIGALPWRLVIGREPPWREILESAAGGLLVYLGSVAIVDASSATAASGTTQGGQLLLSAFWSATGVAAVVAGLVADRRRLRLGGLGLLGIAIVKGFLVDLATLASIYRVG